LSLGASSAEPELQRVLELRLAGAGGPEPPLRIAHFCRFEEEVGVRLTVDSIAGLGKAFDEKYVQVYIEVRRSMAGVSHCHQVINLAEPKKPLGRVVSQHLQPSANLRNPQWRDAATAVVSPGLQQAVVLARLLTTKLEYSPSWDKEPEGKIKGRVELAYNKPEAWAVTGFFTSDGYVDSGTHVLPLFKGAPADTALVMMAEKGVTPEVTALTWRSRSLPRPCSTSSPRASSPPSPPPRATPPSPSPSSTATSPTRWMTRHPQPKPSSQTRFSASQPSLRYTGQLEGVGGAAACCSPGAEGGKRRLAAFVLDSLPPKIRDKGTKSKKYKQVPAGSKVDRYMWCCRRSPCS
jgi:hypothetical protein